MKKLRVGVFMGGKTLEKEVSFNSGRTICDHLDTSKYDIIPLFQTTQGSLYILPWRFLHRGKISDFEQRLEADAKKISWDDLKTTIDFMYIASHGKFVEDGKLQGFLEVLGIPYLGSKVLSSAIGMDKIIQKRILQSQGIDVPKDFVINPEDLKGYLEAPQSLLDALQKISIPLPCMIKPHAEGSSLGTTVVKHEKDLLPAIQKAMWINEAKPQSVIIEEYISGMEFTCIVITDKQTGKPIALDVTEIVIEPGTDYFDYEQKYMPGRATKFTPARCSEAQLALIKDTAIDVMRILDFKTLARIDGFLTTDNRIIIIDPNTLSGMAPSSYIFRQAAQKNMSHTQLINHLIETELMNYGIPVPTQQTEKDMNDHKTKIRVAVLLGGKSHEKEISLESGRNIFYKLSLDKYEPIAIFVDSNLELHRINQSLLVRNSTKEIAYDLEPSMKISWSLLPSIADFVFIGLHGGEGENGCVQGTLETLGLPYNGSSVFASALCMNKYKTNNFLRSQGFDVPLGMLVKRDDSPDTIGAIEKMAPYPLIIKPHDDGCSVLVSRVKNRNELIKALDAIFADGKEYALVEECIMGMELTVGVIGNETPQALPPSQAIAVGDILSIEEKFLPGSGENQTPAPLPDQSLLFVKKCIEKVYKTLSCKGYARIDCFYQNAEESPTKNERLVIIEVNTLPGMTPATCIFHQAAELNIKPMDFIDLIIELGREEHAQKKLIEIQKGPDQLHIF